MRIRRKVFITSWGRLTGTRSEIIREKFQLEDAFTRGLSVIPRGSGMAYGDVAINSKGLHFKLNTDEIQLIDEDTIEVSCSMTIAKVLEKLHPVNKTLYVVPGSKYVSIGGAIASDVHGKNHEFQGCFSNHVEKIQITKDGKNYQWVDKDSDLFKITFGAMGLTGHVSKAQIKIRNLTCICIKTKVEVTNSLETTFEKILENSKVNEFNIAWIDLLNNSKFTNSIIYASNYCDCGNHIYKKPGNLLSIPKQPFNLLNKRFMSIYNRIKFARESKVNNFIYSQPEEVYFPSDIFRNWTNLFGKKGLMEYQFVFPVNKQKEAISLIDRISREVAGTLVAVKVFGEKKSQVLSFPKKGFVFGVTFPWSESLLENVHEWDLELVKMGARKYFSKDISTDSEILFEMYPELNKLYDYRIKNKLVTKWNSDFSRRLGI